MRHLLKTLFLVWLSATSSVLGYSRGAPDTTCASLEPGHGLSRQNSPSPYIITPGAATVEGAKRILVTLKAPDNVEGFKGFLVQARKADSQEIVGTFFTTDHSVFTCGKGISIPQIAWENIEYDIE
ncbi:DOMON domain-containing protein frrs1L [Halocaridina rubra]|uniref:DOMON domain-containing protein frrs1L n=1 Tax=Halocaridina rubra TaxID=373956 RepID=A0AAN8WD99_HALRR